MTKRIRILIADTWHPTQTERTILKTPTTPAMIQPHAQHPTHIGQIAINVKDLPRATAFYRDLLGLEFLFDIPQAAFFIIGEVRLMLGIAERPDLDHRASIVYYAVPDIRAAHSNLSERGALFEDEPHLIAQMPDHELWMCFLRDTEGNLLALMSEVR